MSDSNLHYLLAVRAPGIALNMLRSGAWFTMAGDADVAALEERKQSALPALAAFRGQVAIFQVPLDHPEEAVVVWLSNTDRPPELRQVLTPTSDQRETFWAYVDHYHFRAAAVSAAPVMDTVVASGGEAQFAPIRFNWWLIGAVVALGMMSYAMLPQMYHNSTGRAGFTTLSVDRHVER